MELAVVSSNLSGTIFLKYIRYIFGWLVCFPNSVSRPLFAVVVVVFFTLTDRTSTIPSNIRGCQSGTWSQRGTKVNGSHHGDNPLHADQQGSKLRQKLYDSTSDGTDQ